MSIEQQQLQARIARASRSQILDALLQFPQDVPAGTVLTTVVIRRPWATSAKPELVDISLLPV